MMREGRAGGMWEHTSTYTHRGKGWKHSGVPVRSVPSNVNSQPPRVMDGVQGIRGMPNSCWEQVYNFKCDQTVYLGSF